MYLLQVRQKFRISCHIADEKVHNNVTNSQNSSFCTFYKFSPKKLCLWTRRKRKANNLTNLQTQGPEKDGQEYEIMNI